VPARADEARRARRRRGKRRFMGWLDGRNDEARKTKE